MWPEILEGELVFEFSPTIAETFWGRVKEKIIPTVKIDLSCNIKNHLGLSHEMV